MNSGHSYSVNGGTNNAMAPWMHNFFTWSAGHAAELGFAGAAELRDWLAKFEIGLMTDWQRNPTQGYCWLEASAYTLVVTEPTGKTYLPSYSAMYAATFPSLTRPGLQFAGHGDRDGNAGEAIMASRQDAWICHTRQRVIRPICRLGWLPLPTVPCPTRNRRGTCLSRAA